MNESSKIRVRFAPSPTGYVHIGTLRTALYNYLFAKKHGGEYLLRLEDTDQKRFVPGAAENLLSVLGGMGIMHSEGPFLKEQAAKSDRQQDTVDSKNYPGIIEVGNHGPYIQSERLGTYQKYAQQLIDDAQAYRCFCTPERLEAMREEQSKNKQMPRYDRHCLRLSLEEIQDHLDRNVPHTVRLRLPDDETIVFHDLVRDEVSFRTTAMGDTVLLKSDGYPVYHLANVVDDHLMGITHVIRAEEWLPSTPIHIFLYRAFGWEAPQFAHLPLILNPDRSKLSKRQGDVAVEDYLKKGYLKEALVNFVALLGWNPGEGSTQEIFSMQELIDGFDFDHVHKAGAVFDLKKLDWINAQYIKKLSLDELYDLSLLFWKEKPFYLEAPSERRSEGYIKKVLTIEQERLNRLDEVGEKNLFFFVDTLAYDKELLRWKQNTDEETSTALEKSLEILSGVDDHDWNRDVLSEKLLAAAGERRGDLLWPLRVALTGAKQSPSPFEVAWVLGKTESLRRVSEALNPNTHDPFAPMKRATTLAAVLFIASAIFLSGVFRVSAESASDLQSKLDAINAKIKSYSSLVTQTQQQRTNLSNEIKSLEASAAALEQKINANQAQVQNLSGEIDEIENQIDEKEKIVHSQRSLLKELMRSYYENTDRTQFQLLLSAQESANLLNEGDWTFETGHKIQEMLGSIRAIKKSLALQYDSLRQKKSEADQIMAQLEQRSGYLESTKQSKEYLVMRTQQQEKKYNNIIDDLEEKRHEIEDELNQLDAAKVDQLDLSKIPAFRKSLLYFPVVNPHRSQGYGKTTFTKWYTFHNGIDFADKIGTPIIAAADGKVLATGNNGQYAYGKWIAVDHGNGLVTLYGHLSSQKVSKGESVKRGEVIGLMGSTGYSTGSHVHFTVFAKNSFDIVPSTKKSGLMLPTGAHVNPDKYLP